MTITKSTLSFFKCSGGTIFKCRTGVNLPCLNFAESTTYVTLFNLLKANNASVLCPAPQTAIFLFSTLYRSAICCKFLIIFSTSLKCPEIFKGSFF